MLFNLNLSPIALAENARPLHGWNLLDILGRFFDTNDSTQTILYAVFVVALLIVCMVGGYLIGSINPAIILSKKLYNDDVREHGSGNAGTTNMMRTYGKKMAILNFVLDFSKAAIAVILGSFLARASIGGAVAALFVVLGHMFPIYYKFKGGKGVACTAAVMLVLSPVSFVILVPVFLLIVLAFKYVSLGSVITALLFPVVAFAFQGMFGGSGGWTPLVAVIIALLILFMHRANLKRIMEGKESKLKLGKKKKEAEESEKSTKGAADEAEAPAKEQKPEKIYKDSDFVKCACGRIIPKTREKCVYCGKKNPAFISNDAEKGGKKKKK